MNSNENKTISTFFINKCIFLLTFHHYLLINAFLFDFTVRLLLLNLFYTSGKQLMILILNNFVIIDNDTNYKTLTST